MCTVTFDSENLSGDIEAICQEKCLCKPKPGYSNEKSELLVLSQARLKLMMYTTPLV